MEYNALCSCHFVVPWSHYIPLHWSPPLLWLVAPHGSLSASVSFDLTPLKNITTHFCSSQLLGSPCPFGSLRGPTQDSRERHIWTRNNPLPPTLFKKHSSQSGGGEGKHFTAHQALRRLFHCVPQACEVCGTRFRCNTREPFLVGEDGDAGVAEGLRYYWRCYGRCSLRNCWIGRALTPAPQLSAAGGCVALRASGPGCSSCGTRGCPFRPTAQLCRWDPCMHANGRSDVHLRKQIKKYKESFSYNVNPFAIFYKIVSENVHPKKKEILRFLPGLSAMRSI